MSGESRTVAVIGGGLAGLAAGVALTDAGFRVTVFESKPFLGGRASSYEHPTTGEVVDNCQHVLLGCCTNLLDFYERIGAENLVRWYDRLTFIEPGGRRSVIASCSLPAPLHTVPSFLRANALSLGDKLAITRAMFALMRHLPPDNGRSFLAWLRDHGQTGGAIERFWKVVLVSALNEDLDRVAVPTAAMVFRESFLKSARGGEMGVPRVPLTELYSRAGDYIRRCGGEVRLKSSVSSVSPASSAVKLCSGGEQFEFDGAVLALPFHVLSRVLPQTLEAEPILDAAARFETSPITGIHLWFDREITDLDHAVLLDRTIQWMFHKSRLLARVGDGSYVELVVSASKSLVEESRQDIIDLAMRELAEFFPLVREAKLVKAAVVKEINATYAPLPRIEAHRPSAATRWPHVFLAGDWTASGWPATMEGAVRSGYLAAEALCRASGNAQKFLAPDLPASGLMRVIGGDLGRP